MSKVAVIGAGSMGLAAAYHALKAGHRVVVYEADDQPGGMAAHLEFDGLSIERFYHFVCKSDRALFELLQELGLADAMRWRATSMGYYFAGKVYRWGDPIGLLTFPGIGLLSKLRYGLHAFTSTKRTRWQDLDALPAHQWVQRWIGNKAYDVLWRKLFELKFFEYAENISAAWIWTRLRRIGTSRSSILQEELGYIEGGSETLIQALVRAITAMGGEIRLRARVEEIVIDAGRVSGVKCDGATETFDRVMSTVPIPQALLIIPGLPPELRRRYQALDNIGVVCVVHKLAQSITKHFWLNINDDRIEVPGIIEFSNLRDVSPHHIVYVPYYMPQHHPKFSRDDRFFVEETTAYLKMINPALTDADFKAVRVGRLRYAQPICPPKFLESLPPVQTEIAGLQIADTSYYYPEDRGISESVRFGKTMALSVA